MVNMVICGLGYISRRVAEGCKICEHMHLYGCLSSSRQKAEAFGEEFKCEAIYSDYESLYNDKKVDVLYLCTPNFSHYELTKAALKHHKSVICEKPFVESEEEIKELFELARKNDCFLMEAEKTCFSPLNKKVKDLVKDGVIGKLYHIEASYMYDIRKLNLSNDNWNFKSGGGCSGDVGVYPVSFAHFMSESKIADVKMIKHFYQHYEPDFYYEALITYENGITASVKSSWLTDIENKGKAILYGEHGYIEIPSYWKGKKAYIHHDDKVKEIAVDFVSDFTGEIEHAALMIMEHKNESDVLDEAFSLNIIQTIK